MLMYISYHKEPERERGEKKAEIVNIRREREEKKAEIVNTRRSLFKWIILISFPPFSFLLYFFFFSFSQSGPQEKLFSAISFSFSNYLFFIEMNPQLSRK